MPKSEIFVDSWTVESFRSNSTSGALTVSPEYQRRPVWKPKDKMLLIDSVARGVPIGAITLYCDESKGFKVYEVIDGKQRLSAILNYLDGDLIVKTQFLEATNVAIDDDEFDMENNQTTKDYHNIKFSQLDVPLRMRVLQYKMPVFVVSGSRSDAIRAFTRMNKSPYPLLPQEIRNALFVGTQFLKTCTDLIDNLNEAYSSEPDDSYFLTMGMLKRDQLLRMQDVQLVSELLILVKDGVQHRRDSLDEKYEQYSDPKGDQKRQLQEASESTRRALSQLHDLFGGAPLQAFHFPGSCESDVYGLVGALSRHGLLSAAQMKDLAPELREVIKEFRRQVELFVSRTRDNLKIEPDEFAKAVEDYGTGFLGGQVNSNKRREDRIKVWEDVIDGVAKTLDSNSSFSEMQRRMIWTRSLEKSCARCGKVVSWGDYHAGHRMAHARGGRTVVENGQVEHSKCNQTAGAN